MNRQQNLELVIKKLEPWFLNELREDHWYLNGISGFVNEALGFPDLVKEITAEQFQIKFQTTLDFIYHLIINRNCKVCSIEKEKHGDTERLIAFIDWELSPEDAIEKIKTIWLSLKEPMDPILQPWFYIDEEPESKEDNKCGGFY